MSKHIHVDLTDLDLFGNDAAEDEPEDVFRSYVVERPELTAFQDPDRLFAIARAYKGEGKSALLRLAELRLRETTAPETIILSRTGAELAPDFTSDDYASCTRAWKAAIFTLIGSEIGARLGKAWTDDAMTLVEEAERNGFRSKSLVSSITNRLQGVPEIAGVKIPTPQRADASSNIVAGAVRRRVAGGPPIWLFVDDLDKNFENTPAQLVRIASFFDAARELIREVPQIHVRAAIRPTVWTTLKLSFESLSKTEQYALDLHWSETDCRTLLGRRVEGYLRRKDEWQSVEDRLPAEGQDRDAFLYGFVFESPVQWGKHLRPAHVMIFTLSKHRPRWMIELSKGAATIAHKKGHELIRREDLIADLTAFGDRRLQDTVAEFRSQCADIEEILTAFSRSKEELNTNELLTLIDNKILNHVNVRISGISGKPTALQVAALLFEIGFFYGRRDFEDGTYEHVTYSDRPALLRARSNVDDGLRWEIHPVYRQALEMRDTTGREVARRQNQPHRGPKQKPRT